MKHKAAVLTVLFIALASFTFAQLEKGTFLLGGTLDLRSSTIGTTYPRYSGYDSKTLSFSFSTTVSYFFVKRLSVGLALPYSYTKSTYYLNSEDRTSSFSAGPMIRYYLPFQKVAIFPEVIYTIGQQTLTFLYAYPSYPASAEGTARLNMIRCGVGLTYFLSKSIGIEGIMYYQNNQVNYDSDFMPNKSTASFGMNFGFQIYFNKKG